MWRPRQNLITECHKGFLKIAALSHLGSLVKKGLVSSKLVHIFQSIGFWSIAEQNINSIGNMLMYRIIIVEVISKNKHG